MDQFVGAVRPGMVANCLLVKVDEHLHANIQKVFLGKRKK
jgi:hypothetical protein